MCSSTNKLFAGTGVPDWFPDETLFSLCSRFHRLASNPSAKATAQQLFGNKISGYQHDLPSGIDHFVQLTEGTRGTSREIIRYHTILPFYLPFRSEHDAVDAYQTMASQSIGSLKYRLGILTSRFRANHPLKACLECMLEDRNTHGVAYWHLSQQYPGVYVCQKHHAPLLISNFKSTGIGRFMWFLPEEASLTNSVKFKDQIVLDACLRLAKSVAAIVTLPESFYFPPLKLLQVYKKELFQRGFITDQNCLRLESIAESFLDNIKPLNVISELATLPTTISDAKTQIGRLLRAPRSGTHPLRHIILINWLFNNWESFWNAYLASESTQNRDTCSGQIVNKGGTDNIESKKSEVISLIQQQGFSATHAAQVAGIDTTTAVTWASQAGFAVSRRPKLVSEDMRSKIINSLKRGHDKTKIAKKHGISTATVSRILRSESGLQQDWLDSRFNRRLKLERNRWSKLKISHSNSGVKIMRMIAPITYAWLYRNDQTWLKKINRSIPSVPLSNNSKINWEQRDYDLSQQLQKIVLDASIQNPDTQISLAKICVELPELKAKLERLDKLPLTYKALKQALGRRFRRKQTKSLF